MSQLELEILALDEDLLALERRRQQLEQMRRDVTERGSSRAASKCTDNDKMSEKFIKRLKDIDRQTQQMMDALATMKSLSSRQRHDPPSDAFLMLLEEYITQPQPSGPELSSS